MTLKTSILDYPERGPYGKSGFRGNNNGYILKDFIEWFGVKSVFDPMEGSGTSRDVCQELGVH